MSTRIQKTMMLTQIDAERRVVCLAGTGVSRGRPFPIGICCFVPDQEMFDLLEQSIAVGDTIAVELEANTRNTPAPMILHGFERVAVA